LLPCGHFDLYPNPLRDYSHQFFACIFNIKL
jgi:hypothetical protein